ncbi:MAG TPA: dual specificity protein phosphatase family protein [Candidatus Thermoplasmatota archaeon]|nr:dual specificity protein phosphatase family protein [Candidatus Thermoplasmatota archaeon]
MQRTPHRDHAWLPYWPVAPRLAGGAGIGYGHGLEPDEHVALLEEQGVGAILSLTAEPQIPANGWVRKLHPLPGMMPPRDVAEMELLVAWVEQQRASGRCVFVHCLAGKGRTGTILAGWLMKHRGLGATAAINHLRARQPAAVESEAQEQFVERYEDWLGSQRRLPSN